MPAQLVSAIVDDPLVLLAVSLLLQWTAALAGRLARRSPRVVEAEREEIVTVLNGSLTLLALLIGFSLAMAVGRYDQRKTFEEAEANAISTQYLRADLLPPAAAARAHALLISYTQQRILYYEERDVRRLGPIEAVTERLQNELWQIVSAAGTAQQTAPMMLVVSGMNDVIDAQGSTQSAWWNRIPFPVWILLLMMAVACNALLGRAESRVSVTTLLVLPVLLSVSLFLISEIDSPRIGIIRVEPQNLVAALKSMPPRPPPVAGD